MHHLSPDVLFRGVHSELLLLLSPPAAFRVWLEDGGSSLPRSLSTPAFAPSILPQGTGGIFRAPPPALTTAAQKKTCRHWKHFSILMRRSSEDLWWWGGLRSLWGKTFSSSVNQASPLSRIHSYSSDETPLRSFCLLSPFAFHIPQISFKRRFASFLLSWKTRVLLRFIRTLIWMRSDICWLVEINQPLISIHVHYKYEDVAQSTGDQLDF